MESRGRRLQKDGGTKETYGQVLNSVILKGTEALDIAVGCQLYHFPEKKVYVFDGINLSTITYSPIHDDVKPLLNKVHDQLLN